MKASRRNFLQISGLALGALGIRGTSAAETRAESVSLIADPDDAVASSPQCNWAMKEVARALGQHGTQAGQLASLHHAPPDSFCIVASAPDHQPAEELLKRAALGLGTERESLALVPFTHQKQRGLLATGDARGLMYALLEIADQIQNADHPTSPLEQRQSITDQPFNSIRSIGRIFCSDIHDKPWFYDRDMWPAYFSMLATQRFNRFSLNLGVGYDFLTDVADAYFLFAYAFLLSVPGYNVRAVGLPDEERDRNLEMLQFISSQAVAHGIEFQLGVWTHGYQWGPASKPNYTIEGLNSDNHAAYSRDALAALLKACPDISGVTLRTHGESGVREGSYAFWSTVFSGIPLCGRIVRLDLHTKGLDQNLIEAALKTGMPVTLSPKYWAEHMGMPYQQASIRDLEMPREDRKPGEFFSLSTGSRSFTRYGYADFLREDRPYQVMFRIWPGSHRLLLWGDPSSGAAHARAFKFCGCNGVELFEPLTFKGRRGSGIAGSRCAYEDKSLDPHWDWEKYLYTYRTWGRLIYNPKTDADVWRRYLRKQFGSAAPDVEAALSSATPITEIITTAHLPSAANENFNPEYYTNQSIVDPSKPSPYSDTPSPKVFGNVSPLDPQLFSTINEFATGAWEKRRSGKYSPLEVAQWLDAAADNAAVHLREAESSVRDKNSAEFRRAAVDLKIQIGIGRFFAAKFRSGVLYGVYTKSGNIAALQDALKQYRRARDTWQEFAEAAKGIYVSDITFGTDLHQRGNWLDRLPAIDEDIAEMQKLLEATSTNGPHDPQSLRELTETEQRESLGIQHTPARLFAPGQQLKIVAGAPQNEVDSLEIYLCYRRVNQAERYETVKMQAGGNLFTAIVPADYTNSKYPIQYYFEIRRAGNSFGFFPGLGNKLQQQPYFVVRSAGTSD